MTYRLKLTFRSPSKKNPLDPMYSLAVTLSRLTILRLSEPLMAQMAFAPVVAMKPSWALPTISPG